MILVKTESVCTVKDGISAVMDTSLYSSTSGFFLSTTLKAMTRLRE